MGVSRGAKRSKNQDERPLQAWARKINWEKRVKAVCKPCWEIKYCPYGPLVEGFPLAELDDVRRCRIFGHICPVFQVAEPFTETLELRNVNRKIPRPVQFRVLKRENQVCRQCGNAVVDDDIHFDHVIPYAKGGSSDEHNVQLLCGSCNRRKGTQYELTHLIHSQSHRNADPSGTEIVEFLLLVAGFIHAFEANEGRYPDGKDFAREMSQRRRNSFDDQAAEVGKDLVDFFTGTRPPEISAKVFKALRIRWGFAVGVPTSLAEAAAGVGLAAADLYWQELGLVERLGWPVRRDSTTKGKWLRT